MSELHSETHNGVLGLNVRIKLVDLNHSVRAPEESRKETAPQQVSHKCLSASALRNAKRASQAHSGAEKNSPNRNDRSRVEICACTGARVPVSEFDAHVESCSVCANRVELQVDFIEALELAIYQRLADPESDRVHGAMMISAPKLNFAVCGELEFG